MVLFRLRAEQSDEISTPFVSYIPQNCYSELRKVSSDQAVLGKISCGETVTFTQIFGSDDISETQIKIPKFIPHAEELFGREIDLMIGQMADYPEASEINIVFIGDDNIIDRNKSFVLNIFSSHPLPIKNGNIIPVTVKDKIVGLTDIHVKVVSGCQGGHFKISENTKISAPKSETSVRNKVEYTDFIAGMDEQVQAVRAVVDTQLKSLPIFKRFGLKPSKGLLLIGPPGTGKTLLARTVAKLSDAEFFTKNASEFFNEYAGTGERELRSLFESAEKYKRAVIFIDEIDVITASRDHAQEDLTRRLVNQFLPLMDGMDESSNTIIMGATNRPHVIDPAFRRPGRFDREVFMKIPEAHQRAEIFDLYLNRMGGLPEVDRKSLAEITEGYVGADIEGVCREVVLKHVENDRKIGPALFVDVIEQFISARDRAFPLHTKRTAKCSIQAISTDQSSEQRKQIKTTGRSVVELDALIVSDVSEIISFLSLSSTYYQDYDLFITNSQYLNSADFLKILRMVEIVGYGASTAYVVTDTPENLNLTGSLKATKNE